MTCFGFGIENLGVEKTNLGIKIRGRGVGF
jgi:hypothetical protein